jgi:hypothetical protein
VKQLDAELMQTGTAPGTEFAIRFQRVRPKNS